jgi:ribosome-binding factor A
MPPKRGVGSSSLVSLLNRCRLLERQAAKSELLLLGSSSSQGRFREEAPRSSSSKPFDKARSTRVMAELAGTRVPLSDGTDKKKKLKWLTHLSSQEDPKVDNKANHLDRRTQRQVAVIQEVLTKTISAGNAPLLKDANGRIPMITKVNMSGDLRMATVLFVPPFDPRLVVSASAANEKWQRKFNLSRGVLRKHLGQHLRRRGPPDLAFAPDDDLVKSIEEMVGG